MNLKNKILIIAIVVIFISVIGVYSAQYNEISSFNNETNTSGCCSIVLQLDNSDSIMTFRRDSNLNVDINIEEFDWRGIPAIKQYKEDGGYFYQVIVTQPGWVIGFGGIDDGLDNERCVNITYDMISNGNISEDGLKKIQEIKKPYGRGHVLIKSPKGDYGLATTDKIQTGKLEPGEYISIPNNYSYYRSGNISLDNHHKIKQMNKLAQSDKYGYDRRDITTYELNVGENNTTVDVYLSNDDGSKLDMNYTDCVDDVYFNNTLTKADNIPIAPKYKTLGSIVLVSPPDNTMTYIVLIVSVILVIALSFGVYKFVKFIKFKIRR